MSVPVNQRSEGKLEVCIKARDLCQYTLQITSNPKVFTERYQHALTDEINKTAIEIYESIYSANDIYVNTIEDWGSRKLLQNNAIRKCNRLLVLIDTAKPLFHLASKRVFYWGGKAIEIKNMIRRWKESDADRYRKKLNL